MSRLSKDSNHASGHPGGQSKSYRARFFVVVVLFSFFLSGIGLWLGARILSEERLAAVRELNASNVKSLASEAGVVLTGVAERMRFMSARPSGELAEAIRTDADIVSLTVYQPISRADYWEPTAAALNPEFAKLYGFSAKALDKLRRAVPIPFPRVVAEGSWLVSTALDADAPLATLAISAGGNNSVVVADLRTDRWAKRVGREGSSADSALYLVDSRGSPIAHPDLRSVSRRFADGDPPLSAVPIVRDAMAQGSQTPFQSEAFDWDGRRWLGAYAESGFAGVIAATQVSERSALTGVERLERHSALLALLGLTLALIGAAWLVRDPGVQASVAKESAKDEIADEYQQLLRGIRARIEQVRTMALEAAESSDPELDRETEKMRDTLLECSRRLQNLGEQAGWAGEIFKKLRKVGVGAEAGPASEAKV